MTQHEMLVAIYGGMQELKSDVQILKGKVQVIEDKVQVIEDKVQVLENGVRGLELTLENETNKNIRVIAEGHLDLNRRLDEALKADAERELMHLRVNVLENDMRRVKEKVGIA